MEVSCNKVDGGVQNAVIDISKRRVISVNGVNV